MPDLYFYRDPEEIEQNASEETKTSEDVEEAPAAQAEAEWTGETEEVDWAESAAPAAEEAAASNW